MPDSPELLVILVWPAVVGYALLRHQAYLRGVATTWRAAARSLGGDFRRSEFLRFTTGFELDATLGRVAIRGEILRRSNGALNATRFVARVPHVWRFGLTVKDRSRVPWLGKWLGPASEVKIGALGHDSLPVYSDDEALARAWMSARICGMLRSPTLTAYGCAMGSGTIWLERDGIAEDEREIAAAVRLTAALAERSYEFVDAWHALAVDLGGVLRGGSAGPLPPFDLALAQGVVSVTLERDARGSFTRVHASRPRHRTDEDLRAAAAQRNILGLVVTPESLEVTLAELFPRAEDVRPVIDALAELTGAASAGVYR